MFGVRIIAASWALVLAGCTNSPSSLPDWLTIKPPPPPMQTLRFESEPPGAEARTAQGQVCRTPCALALPLTNQSVTFSMPGFLPQTVAVQVTPPGERSEQTFAVEPPTFAPNPVEAALQPAPPPRKPPPPKRRKIVARPPPQPPVEPTAFPPPPPPGPPPMQPAPVQRAPAASPFPPPPPPSPGPPPPAR